jgi:hypothetical protein
MPQPAPAPNRADDFRKVWEMIDGLMQMWAVIHSPHLLLMPDGRTRLLWNTARVTLS